jgi:hypothetical protein
MAGMIDDRGRELFEAAETRAQPGQDFSGLIAGHADARGERKRREAIKNAQTDGLEHIADFGMRRFRRAFRSKAEPDRHAEIGVARKTRKVRCAGLSLRGQCGATPNTNSRHTVLSKRARPVTSR